MTTVLGYSLVSLFLYLLGALTVDFYVQICYSLRALMFVSKLYFKAKNQGRQHFCAICLDFYFEKDSWISLLEAIRKRKFHLQNRISFDISRSELLGLRPENLHGIKALNIVQDTMEQKSTENNLIGIVSDGLKNKQITVTPEFLFHSPEDVPILNPHELRHTLASLLKNKVNEVFYINHVLPGAVLICWTHAM